MSSTSNLLYVRGEETKSENEDIWDDTALIQAYDKAVNMAKEEVAKRIAMDSQSQQTKQKSSTSKHHSYADQRKKWTVGSPCRAIYSVDGEIYEAIIEKIHENGLCTVKFIGYNNTEKVELKSLSESKGLQSQVAQQKSALAQKNDEETADSDTSGYSTHQKPFNVRVSEKMDCDTEDHRPFRNNFKDPGHGYFNSAMLNTMPPPPPLPPQLMAKLPETDADALSSMLMSWYISGFHTGYYHGLQQAKLNNQKRRNCQ